MILSDAADDPCHRCANTFSRLVTPPAAALLVFFAWVSLGFGAMADRDIETAIDTRLSRDDAVRAQSIEVTVRDGIATLDGSTPTLAAADRAERVAMAVKGVRAVVDQMSVDPAQRDDEAIRDDVREALALDPVTDVDAIGIDVRDAKVSLSGEVDSWPEKTLAAAVVKGVEGVREVVDRLTVDPVADRADDDIAAEVERRLARDVWVEASGIDVAVTDGAVRLSGVVGSLAEKRKAVRNAWIGGVRSVSAENLEVDWDRHRAVMKSNPQKVLTDAEVEEAVEAALRYDPRVPEERIEVWSDHGVVTLKGTVDVLSAARAAREDAENTAGVWMVRNRVKVRPSVGSDYRPIRDLGSRIADKVRLAFLLDPQLRQHAITVTVNDAMAVLEGKVTSEEARERATDAAAGIRGVVRVVNRLEVMSDAEAVRREDWQIRKDIESEMRWSPFVDAEGVSVAVEDGEAVLTGVVEDLKARRTATVNAREGGAVRVKNHLRVRYGPDFLQP